MPSGARTTCFTGVSIEPEEGELLKSPELGVFASASSARHRPCSVLHAHGAARAAAPVPTDAHSLGSEAQSRTCRSVEPQRFRKLAERSESTLRRPICARRAVRSDQQGCARVAAGSPPISVYRQQATFYRCEIYTGCAINAHPCEGCSGYPAMAADINA